MPRIQYFTTIDTKESRAGLVRNRPPRARGLAITLFEDCAPDLEADWLFGNLQDTQCRDIAFEFQRQAIERAAEAGLAGRA